MIVNNHSAEFKVDRLISKYGTSLLYRSKASRLTMEKV
jgi:hypothetical protein